MSHFGRVRGFSRREAYHSHIKHRLYRRFGVHLQPGYFRDKIDDGTAYLVRTLDRSRSLWLVSLDGRVALFVYDEARQCAVTVLRPEWQADGARLLADWHEHATRLTQPAYQNNRQHANRAHLARRTRARITEAKLLASRC